MSKTIKVLFVDDEPDIRTIVEIALGLDPAIELRSMESGVNALAMLDSERWLPDVALIDMRMPEMGGLELLSRLRERPEMATTPIVFMTASARPTDIEAYRAAGANDVIIKAFDPLSLASRIRQYCA
jgi:CheY-like chemotaxis protein